MEFSKVQNDLMAILTANGESLAKDIATQLNMSKADAAKALGELHKAGIVSRDLRDKKLFYKMAAEAPIEVTTSTPAPKEEVTVTAQGEVTETSEDLVTTEQVAEEGAKVVAMGGTKAKPAKAATEKKTVAKKPAKRKVTPKADKTEAAPKPPTAKDLIFKIKKAKTEADVKAIAGDDKRASVIAAGVKRIAAINAPPAKAKPKKAKSDANKVAPAKEFINEDGTLDYAKLSKPKRGDLVEFEAWGENPASTGIVLFPDWDFWQGKVYLKVLGANGKTGWKSVTKVTKVLAKKAAKSFIEGNKLKEAFEKGKVPAWRDWKVDICKKALAAK